jgi:hypothetical protein
MADCRQQMPPTYPVAWPDVRFAPATGTVELAVGEGLGAPLPRPARVTALLSAILDQVNGEPATPEIITRLSVGTREWLLQQAGASCRPVDDWFEATCPDCGTSFDIMLDLGALPRAAEPAGFPKVSLSAPWGEVVAQVPNGAHEEALAQARLTGIPAMRGLLALCALGDADADRIEALPDAEIARLDAALDAATPDCADQVSSACPACGGSVSARIDPLEFAFPSEAPVLSDVHVLGSRYNWSEADILTLPTRRRRTYVAMITKAGQREGGRP